LQKIKNKSAPILAKFEAGTGKQRDLAILISYMQELDFLYDEMITNPPAVISQPLSEEDANKIADFMTRKKE